MSFRIKSFLSSLFIIFFSAYATYGQLLFTLPKPDTSEVRLTPLQELRRDIDVLLDSPDFSNAFVGVSVFSIESGEYFYQYNDSKNFVPASSLKLITTATAQKYLGADYRFRTRLYLNGEIRDNGVFVGDVYVRGYGDPTFSKKFSDSSNTILNYFADVLDSVGVKQIKGNIIGDDNFFDEADYPAGWNWDDMIHPYSAQISALSINDNAIEIRVKSGDSVGAPAEFYVKDNCGYAQIINNVRTVKENEPTIINPYRERGENVIEIYGTISYDSSDAFEKSISITIDNPTLYFLTLFRNVLEKRKMQHKGALLDIDDLNYEPGYHNMKLIAENLSIELREIIKPINEKSHNLASEIILKTIGAETLGFGSTAAGIEQVKKFISRLGVPPEKISIADGSGLSRLNLISPKYMTTFLSGIYRSSYREDFINSLAAAGEKGTLKRRMRGSLAENKVYAKTGSMNNLSTLSGYVWTRDGEPLAFSIMALNYTVPISLAHNLQDMICMRLVGFSRKAYEREGNKGGK